MLFGAEDTAVFYDVPDVVSETGHLGRLLQALSVEPPFFLDALPLRDVPDDDDKAVRLPIAGEVRNVVAVDDMRVAVREIGRAFTGGALAGKRILYHPGDLGVVFRLRDLGDRPADHLLRRFLRPFLPNLVAEQHPPVLVGVAHEEGEVVGHDV